MKVIEENKSFGVFPMKVKCQRVVDEYGFSYGDIVDFCGSVLEVEASDVKLHPWEKYPAFKGADYGVVCPVCGMFVPIDKGLLPKQVKDTAPEIRLSSR